LLETKGQGNVQQSGTGPSTDLLYRQKNLKLDKGAKEVPEKKKEKTLH